MITPDTNNPIFKIAIDFVNQTNQHIFLTGKAGTGKTTFLKYIRHHTHKNCLVAAPTGVAAINAGGVTLHSLFQLPFEPFIPGLEYRSTKDRFKISASKIDMLRQLELLIIDEVSMLRADLLDSIDATLRRTRRSDKPFGGIQMLYIGDLFQLPPVAKEEEWQILKDYYRSPFFFHSKAVEKVPPIYLELKTIYRQREQQFVDLLNRVRNDEMTASDIQLLNQRCNPAFSPSDEEKYITLTTHNYQSDQINSQKLAKLKGPAYKYQGKISGEFPDYALPTDMELVLKKGTQIMFIKNDQGEDRRYYNGKLATVTCLDEEDVQVTTADDNIDIVLGKETWKNIRYHLNKETGEIEEEELGSFVQYPIRLAWAITIHKGQGLTFERAVIDTGKAFAAGQAYVALSRCTSLDGIVLLSPMTQKSVKTDDEAIKFASKEKNEPELNEILQIEKLRFWADRLLKYFDLHGLTNIPREFKKMLEDKDSDEYHSARKLAEDMFQQTLKIRDVADKFQKQLKGLVMLQQQSGDLKELKERCQKAVIYFHQQIFDTILVPFQLYIASFNIKKAKTYHKQLCNLEQDIILSLENLKKVRYNNIPLVEDLELTIPIRRNLLNHESGKPGSTDKKTDKKENTKAKLSQEKEEKISSKKQSFDLFIQGLSIPEIASERNMSPGTIASHLCSYIKNGDLPVHNILSTEIVDTLYPIVQKAVDAGNLMLGPIKEQVGLDYSYDDIRLVLSHCLYEQQANSKELQE